MPTPVPTAFTVFGYGFTLGGNSHQAIEGLAEDFAFFAAGGAAMPMRLVLDEGRPDYRGPAALPNISLRHGTSCTATAAAASSTSAGGASRCSTRPPTASG